MTETVKKKRKQTTPKKNEIVPLSTAKENAVLAQVEDNHRKTESKALSPEEKTARIIEITKELNEHQKKTIELYKKLDELHGVSNKDGPPLNHEERAMIEQWKEQKKKKESPFCYNATVKSKTKNGNKDEKFDLSRAGLSLTTGSSDMNFGFSLVGKSVIAAMIGENNENYEKTEDYFNSIANVMYALKPQDEIEGMLISRLVALHYQSIHYLGCAANNESTQQGRDININRSTKLARLYNETLEALMRYRRKGEQKVIVQHVNVNDGGKAIVSGNMIAGGGGQQ